MAPTDMHGQRARQRTPSFGSEAEASGEPPTMPAVRGQPPPSHALRSAAAALAPPRHGRIGQTALLPRWALEWYQEQASKAQTPEEVEHLTELMERGVMPGCSNAGTAGASDGASLIADQVGVGSTRQQEKYLRASGGARQPEAIHEQSDSAVWNRMPDAAVRIGETTLPRWAHDWYLHEFARASTPEEVMRLQWLMRRGYLPPLDGHETTADRDDQSDTGHACFSNTPQVLGASTRSTRNNDPVRDVQRQRRHTTCAPQDTQPLQRRRCQSELHVPDFSAPGNAQRISESRASATSHAIHENTAKLSLREEPQIRCRKGSVGGAGRICDAFDKTSADVTRLDCENTDSLIPARLRNIESQLLAEFMPHASGHVKVEKLGSAFGSKGTDRHLGGRGSVDRRKCEYAAAARIQAAARGSAVRRSFQAKIWFVLQIQALWRGRAARRLVWERLRQRRVNEAAQRRQRRRQSDDKMNAERRQKDESRRCAALRVQSAYRAAVARQEASARQQAMMFRLRELHQLQAADAANAAMIIQTRWRVACARVEVAHRREMVAIRRDEEEESALLLQSRWRGSILRKIMATKVANRRYQRGKQAGAATKIQSRWRGVSAQNEAFAKCMRLQELRQAAAVIIQRRARCLSARLHAKVKKVKLCRQQQYNAAAMIQSVVRGKAARSTADALREERDLSWQRSEELSAALVLQAAFRIRAARRGARESRRKASGVHDTCASDPTCLNVGHANFAFLASEPLRHVQNAGREISCEHVLFEQTFAALTIQSRYRGRLSRSCAFVKRSTLGRVCCEQEEAARVIQHAYRAKRAELEEAAFIIQCAYRRKTYDHESQGSRKLRDATDECIGEWPMEKIHKFGESYTQSSKHHQIFQQEFVPNHCKNEAHSWHRCDGNLECSSQCPVDDWQHSLAVGQEAEPEPEEEERGDNRRPSSSSATSVGIDLQGPSRWSSSSGNASSNEGDDSSITTAGETRLRHLSKSNAGDNSQNCASLQNAAELVLPNIHAKRALVDRGDQNTPRSSGRWRKNRSLSSTSSLAAQMPQRLALSSSAVVVIQRAWRRRKMQKKCSRAKARAYKNVFVQKSDDPLSAVGELDTVRFELRKAEEELRRFESHRFAEKKAVMKIQRWIRNVWTQRRNREVLLAIQRDTTRHQKPQRLCESIRSAKESSHILACVAPTYHTEQLSQSSHASFQEEVAELACERFVAKARQEHHELNQQIFEAKEEITQLERLLELSATSVASSHRCRSCDVHKLQGKDLVRALIAILGITVSWCGGTLTGQRGVLKLTEVLTNAADINPQIAELATYLASASGTQHLSSRRSSFSGVHGASPSFGDCFT